MGWHGDNPTSAREATLEDEIRQMLHELGQALSAAIADSDQISDTLSRIRSRGLGLFLLVDSRAALGDAVQKDDGVCASLREPVFRINGRDLRFLQSIGIDPTRRLRRRTRRS